MPAYAVRYPIDRETSNVLIIMNASNPFVAGMAIVNNLRRSASTASLSSTQGFSIDSLGVGETYPIKEVLIDKRRSSLSIKREVRVVGFVVRSPLPESLFCLFLKEGEK